jgi:uncharacterized protein (TIGR02145 family)
MRKQLPKLALTAAIALALTLTTSCGNHSWEELLGLESSSSQPSSSSQRQSSSSLLSSSSQQQSSSSSLPSSSSGVEYTGGSCDIKDYGTVQIGSQTWMAKNWGCYVTGSVCYKNDPANCAKYGHLYDWATTMALNASCNSSSCASQIKAKHQGICPSGWHIPSVDDWEELVYFVESNNGCSNCAASYLKTSEWGGIDDYGFSALPGGYGRSGGVFSNVGDVGYWWSASENISGSAYYRSMLYNYESVGYRSINKYDVFSVRCLQD